MSIPNSAGVVPMLFQFKDDLGQGKGSLARGMTIAGVILVLDQLTKRWILESVMNPPQVVEVTGFFNLVLTWNRGISFGLFNNDSSYNALALSALAAVIVAVLTVWLWRADRWHIVVAIGSIIGGAIGNVIDRFRFGAVVDFLDVHLMGLHWPAFNVADAAISLGAVALVFDALFQKPEKPKTKGSGDAD
ncbi:MAG: signal peptidase II [Rhodospirillales bacterium]